MFGEFQPLFLYIKEKMNPRILEINKNIQPYKEEIVNHALYKKIDSVEDVIFNGHHVYACLGLYVIIRLLQSILTCTSLP